MKRIALLAVLLLVVGLSLGFAQEIKPSISLSGSGSVTWGVNLDSMDTGFYNASDADLTLTLIPEDSTVTHNKADAPIYGEITISDIEAFFGGDDAALNPWTMSDWLEDADVSAKIVAKPLEIGVFAGPDLTTDSVTAIENDDVDDDIVDDESGLDLAPAFGAAGTYVAYVTDTLTFKAIIKTDNNADDFIGGYYSLGVNISATFSPITAEVNAGYNFDGDALFGGKLTLAMSPITVYAGADASYAASALAFEVGAGASVAMEKLLTLSADMVYGPAAGGTDTGLDAKVALDVAAVENLTATVTFYLLDVLNTPDTTNYEALVSLAYKYMLDDTNYVKPFADVTYGGGQHANAPSLTGDIGIDIAMIPLTVITVKYASGNFMATPIGLGTVSVGAAVTF
jgi:hypothetical protein